MRDDFYPNKIRKSKLYIDATLKDIYENYHIKRSFFQKVIKAIKRVFSK